MTRNLVMLTDSYKCSHSQQYPVGSHFLHSFLEARIGGITPSVLWFGLQALLHEYLCRPVTLGDVAEAREYLGKHFGQELMNHRGWYRIVDKHDGYLPLRIRAVPEGTDVPVGNVLMTVENLYPDMPWLTNYVESLLVQVWYPCSVATRSRNIKRRILQALEETGTPETIDFKLHDFGFRGSTSPESAALGGCAHLVNFKGTDTLPALVLAREVYGEEMAGFSIPAAEHSTITSWGPDHEEDAYRNMLTQYPKGMVAVVSDSYDIFRACRDLWGGTLREQVLERDGVLVVRPDSGYPPDVVLKVLRILGDKFGDEKNDKGFAVLHPKVRVIQGDGIDEDMVSIILGVLEDAGWSADNIAFGSGGGLLQKGLDRDTHRFAFKASAIEVHGQYRDVMKQPVTDPSKNSKAGRLALVKTASGYETVRLDALGDRVNELKTVYEAGRLVNPTTLAEVRQRAALVSSSRAPLTQGD